MTTPDWNGIYPALVTPLDEDERLDTPALHDLIGFLLQKGVDGFYVGGATGEGLALREEERIRLAEEAVRAVGGRKPCIVQIAATDFHMALRLAKQAEAVGADGISATPPLFFGYDEEDVYEYYKALAEAVHIPMMIYYNPSAGFAFRAELAARLFEIENITAIKWTHPSFDEMLRLKDLTQGDMTVFNGPDQMLLQGLSAGADGGIGTTYNFQSDAILRVYRSFRCGDLCEAQRAQTEVNRVIAALRGYELIPATKLILQKMGFAVGQAAFPMKRYTQEQAAELYATLQKAGLTL